MANIKSAKKRVLQSNKRRLRNVSRKSEIKTLIKKLNKAVAASQEQEAQDLFKTTQAKLQRAAGKHTLHKKTASRKIGRLAQAMKKAFAK